ncbi:GIY-YIG nuclease family protein [Streptomyces abyssomicinicus]|uniref:GIY-YIG nuclease family protein n=1 Tax=Streptomyces abyssomicinicus TaxID=574929 RepID=UPI00350E357F
MWNRMPNPRIRIGRSRTSRRETVRKRCRVPCAASTAWASSGEATPSRWMADHAQVCWIERSEPWDLESQLVSQLDLPLNLDQNRHNAFHGRLKELRARARGRARKLPISS